MTRRTLLPRLARLAYWLLPIAALAVLVAWIQRSSGLLRYEEVAESVRGPYWLRHGAVYDGISSNVSWYAFLAAVYEAFGFTLTTARWAKAALWLGSMLSLAWLLERALPRAWAAVLLAAVAFSPTLLFFTTVATTYGTDLLAVPYVLSLIELAARPRCGELAARLLTAAAWAMAMAAAMAYPVFLFSLPALAWWQWRRWEAPGLPAVPRWRLAAAVAGFVAPLAAALALLSDRTLLIRDPHTGSGLFRGGGGGLAADPELLRVHVQRVAEDLLRRGDSYYFWLPAPDLGSAPARIAAVAALAAGLWTLARRRGWRLGAFLLLTLPAAAVTLTGLSAGPPGLRRATTLLAALWALLALLGRELSRRRVPRTAALAGLVLAALLPIHHLRALEVDTEAIPRAGRRQNLVWVKIAATPEEAVEHWRRHTAAGRPLDCREVGVKPRNCQYSNLFALLEGGRRWNGEPSVPLRGWHPETGQVVPLSIDLWSSWSFPH